MPCSYTDLACSCTSTLEITALWSRAFFSFGWYCWTVFTAITSRLFPWSRPACKLSHVQYINILTWLRGLQVKLLYLVVFSLYPSLLEIEGQKKLEKFAILTRKTWSHARILYWYIERGLLATLTRKPRSHASVACWQQTWPWLTFIQTFKERVATGKEYMRKRSQIKS